ncbi:hypothetical protein HC891_11665 [Candidatus Gracilibacteria bacterium]|nr:hypothetical protein [Candidatus Gracilibacteria bacterium]
MEYLPPPGAVAPPQPQHKEQQRPEAYQRLNADAPLDGEERQQHQHEHEVEAEYFHSTTQRCG